MTAVGSNPRRVNFFLSFLKKNQTTTSFMYLSYAFWEEKVFIYNFLINIDTYWQNNAYNKYGT
jgi:hypothetical protein